MAAKNIAPAPQTSFDPDLGMLSQVPGSSSRRLVAGKFAASAAPPTPPGLARGAKVSAAARISSRATQRPARPVSAARAALDVYTADAPATAATRRPRTRLSAPQAAPTPPTVPPRQRHTVGAATAQSAPRASTESVAAADAALAGARPQRLTGLVVAAVRQASNMARTLYGKIRTAWLDHLETQRSQHRYSNDPYRLYPDQDFETPNFYL